MTVATLIADLEGLGVRLWEEEGRLRFRAPSGVLTEARRRELSDHKAEVIEFLLGDAGRVTVQPEPERRFEPFPLGDLQSAYLLGRRDSFAYGGVGSHIYAEISFTGLAPDAVIAAWHTLVDRHDMLRARIDPSGTQRVQEVVPTVAIPVGDLRGEDSAAVEAAVDGVRAALAHRVYQPDQWPLFDLAITRADDHMLLHLSIDFLVADFSSIQRLLLELNQLCYRPDEPLPPIDISYRDYLVAVRRARDSARHERDQQYWQERMDTLPAGPDLPLVDGSEQAPPTFTRYGVHLRADRFAALRERAAAHDVTVSTAALAAFAEVIGRWSNEPRFSLNLTLFDRQPLHPSVPQLVGDFTAIMPHEVDSSPVASFAERARDVQARLWNDMDHRAYTGVEVLRELARRKGARAALFPVVFTSTIGMNDVGTGAEQRAGQGRFVYGVTQTPQVWIDCQVSELDDGLTLNWDVRDGVLRGGVAEAMVDAYTELVGALAAGDAAWESMSPVRLPRTQRDRRHEVNDTMAPLSDALLHDGVIAMARREPDRLAIIAGTRSLTFGELLGRASAVADRLRAAGCGRGDLVAVVMDRGWEQPVAALGALLAGAAYVPVDAYQPAVRRDRILSSAGVTHVLTQSWFDDIDGIPVDLAGLASVRVDRGPAEPDDIAYVIHTSGSTGVPKGVMVTHRGAVNTVDDINRRFGVGRDDRVLGLAHLGFDLSVYDHFGPVAVGGALVVPDPSRHADPSHWAELIETHHVTLLNTVPAQMHMLAGYLGTTAGRRLPSLRLAWMSGDRIPAALPGQIRDRLPDIDLVGLGGPTETTIWSIHQPIGVVDPAWSAIPYGKPLTNHAHHVLDRWLRDRPDWVNGEICTTGAGVALGYLNDPDRTAEKFVAHPESNARMYRSGDIGRYLPDGTIEILGREDAEVKVRGYRVALTEIEAALATHADVAAAAVVVDDTDPVDARLVAFVVPGAAKSETRPPAEEPDIAAWVDAATDALGDATDRLLALGAELDRAGLAVMLAGLVDIGAFDRPEHWYSVAGIVADGRVVPRYARLVRRWLRALVTEGVLIADGDRYRLAAPFDPDAAPMAWQRVRAIAAELPSEAPLIGYFAQCATILPDLLRGTADPIQMLYPQGTVHTAVEVFQRNLVSHTANVLLGTALADLAGTPDRRARVLELGAGHWGAAAELMPRVPDADYLFTDVSEFFVTTARGAYAGRPHVRFAVFDMNRDFRTQGLPANGFDVIVAANVMHYARDADQVLTRLREMLAPGGALVFTETVRDNYLVETSVEFLFQFDEQSPDFTDARQGRDASFLSAAQWHDVLTRAGGTAIELVPGDEHPLSRLGARLFAARFKTDRADPDPAALRAHVAERLPGYLVPATIELVDALPVTDNAKIDRATLRGWLRPRGDERVTATDTGDAPHDDLERRVAALWGTVLGAAEIGRDQDFFALGGDSLLAARLVGDISEHITEATDLFFEDMLAAMLRTPTVAGLAAYLRDHAVVAGGDAEPETGALVPLDGVGTLVLVHDGTGQVEDLPAAFALVTERLDGSVEATATRYADEILARDLVRVRLRGRGFGGPLAVEVARALMEAGVLVESVEVDVDYRPPYRIGDEIVADYCFALETGCELEPLAMPADRASVARAMRAAGQPVTADLIPGFEHLVEVPEGVRRDRLYEAYRKVRPGATLAQARAARESHRRALDLAVGFVPDAYAGDLVLLPGGEWPWQPAGDGFWAEIGLGDVTEADGA